MVITATIKLALTNLRANKMRSFLTMLGLIIGISSVIIIISVGAGAQSLIVNQVRSLGSNLVSVLPGDSEDSGPPAAVFGIVTTTLKNSDTEAIANQVPHVIAAASYVTSVQTATWGNQSINVSILGTSASYPLITDAKTANGTFFSRDDEKSAGNIAVLGSQVATDLFGNTSPINQSIKIKKINFSIVGVMEPQGTSGFQNVDNMIFIPVTTAQNKIVGIDHIGFMRVKIDREENLDEAEQEITFLLRDRHNIDNPTKDDFTTSNTKSTVNTLLTITNALKLFLVTIAAISLLVGGIGIMNIMLASVTERIKEIGLRKAVGAKRRTIIIQFLTETITIALLGAIIGIAFGAGFSTLVAIIMTYIDYKWDLVISLGSILLSCGMAVSIGLIFGLYPAIKASRLDPITALRYE